MTYTLADFDLRPGDFVRFASANWRKFISYKADSESPYHFTQVAYKSSIVVEAVLRPSIIIREKLDIILESIQTNKITSPGRDYVHALSFEIVQPRKKEEPKKSLFEEWEQVSNASFGSNKGIKVLCDRIEELEKKLKEVKNLVTPLG